MTVVDADWVPWASATFTGARHRLTIVAEKGPATMAWLAALPEMELPIAGHLVADLAVIAVEQDEEALRATLEVLTVEEC